MQREWLLSLLRGYSEMGTQKLYKRIQMISNDAYDSFVVVAVEVFTYP